MKHNLFVFLYEHIFNILVKLNMTKKLAMYASIWDGNGSSWSRLKRICAMCSKLGSVCAQVNITRG